MFKELDLVNPVQETGRNRICKEPVDSVRSDTMFIELDLVDSVQGTGRDRICKEPALVRRSKVTDLLVVGRSIEAG